MSTATQLRSAQTSMGSIRSHQSNPRVRANNRSKRSVDFSGIRNRSQHHHRKRRTTLAAPTGSEGVKSTSGCHIRSPSGHTKEPKAHQVSVTQSMVDVGHTTEDSLIWSQELEQLGHRIARDCDEAFRSSLLLPEPGETGVSSVQADPIMLPLQSSLAVQERSVSSPTPHPWNNRPLPPLPSKDSVAPPSSLKDHGSASLEAKLSQLNHKLDLLIPDRRVVSEPTYDRPGKDARPLPSIRENTSDNRRRQNGGGYNLDLAPFGTPACAQNKELDLLARPENTIRVVHPSSTIGAEYLVDIPEPLNIRKVSPMNNNNASLSETSALHGCQRPSLCESRQKSRPVEGNRNDSTISKKRVSSWFKRHPKEVSRDRAIGTTPDSSVRTKETMVASGPRNQNPLVSQYSDDPSLPRPTKKKLLGLSFWKGTREETKMSIAGM